MLLNAMARKPIVMALDMPVTDQPVSRAMGCRNTGSENMPPIGDAAQHAAGRDDHPAISGIAHVISQARIISLGTRRMEPAATDTMVSGS